MDEEKKGFTKEEIIKLLLIFVVLLAMFLYSVFSDNDPIKKTPVNSYKDEIIKLFEPLTDNYLLTINRTIDDNEDTIEYITDGTFKLYNKINEEKGYLKYKGVTYNVQLEGFKIKQIKNEPEFVNDCYYNIDFIKSILVYCDIKKEGYNRLICNMELSNYVNGYNNYYYTHYVYDGEEIITFDIKYDNVVNTISVDYSEANKVIKNSDNDIKYVINVSRINSNDYSYLFEVFKDTLNK